jgi:hypothetical protein
MKLRSVLFGLTVLSFNLALAAGTPPPATAATATPVVPFEKAADFYNQTKTIEGTIVGTFCDDQRCYLNFHSDFRKYVSAVIEAPVVKQLTPAATAEARKTFLDGRYMGKKVQITGQIVEYRSKDPSKPGRPQILVTSPTSIK